MLLSLGRADLKTRVYIDGQVGCRVRARAEQAGMRRCHGQVERLDQCFCPRDCREANTISDLPVAVHTLRPYDWEQDAHLLMVSKHISTSVSVRAGTESCTEMYCTSW